jgi:hypothetical protein
MKIYPQKEIEKYFVKCDFDDTCDICKNPKGGSYASGYVNDECGCEVDYYICGKCATKAIPEIIKNNKKFDEYLKTLNSDLDRQIELTNFFDL